MLQLKKSKPKSGSLPFSTEPFLNVNNVFKRFKTFLNVVKRLKMLKTVPFRTGFNGFQRLITVFNRFQRKYVNDKLSLIIVDYRCYKGKLV